MTAPPLFRGPESLRVRGERLTLGLVLLTLPLTLLVLGWLLQHAITWQQGMLLLVVAMVYVTLSRGRLLGGSLRVHAGQFGEIHTIVEECARSIGVPTPQVFVRDDPLVPIVGVGIGEPYAVIISGQYLDHLQPDELRFLVGREIAQIANGNARLTSLLSANGRENAIVSIAFGPWLRRIEYTADRVGLLCCGSLDAAISAIAVTTLQGIGRRVDLAAFAEQRRELDAEPLLRAGEWLAPSPFATNRIAELRVFSRDAAYLRWLPRFAAARAAGPAADLPVPAGNRLYVGPLRRILAFGIDSAIVASIVTGTPAVVLTSDLPEAPPAAASVHPAPRPSPGGAVLERAVAELAKNGVDAGTIAAAAKPVLADRSARHGLIVATAFTRDSVVPLMTLLYCILMVALMGRTVGMLIVDARVEGVRGERVGIGRALLRYVSLLAAIVWIPGWFSFVRRVMLYDRLSGTRLIAGNAPTIRSADGPRAGAGAPPAPAARA